MVEEGGIHRAARRLGLSQPPLSMALKELEQDLGCQLIFRHGKNWIITEAGNRLYEEGRAILARMRGLKTRVNQQGNEIHGIVRAGFSTSCVSMFRRILPAMVKNYPHVTCQALFSDSERLSRHVRQRMVELAVLYLPLEGKEYDIIPLQSQRLMAVYSSLLPSPPAGELDLATICQWPLMIPRRWTGGGIYEIIRHALQLQGLDPHIICFSQDSFVLLDLLATVPAVAIIPQCEIEGVQTFEERQIADLRDPLTPAVISLKNIWLSKPARKMVAILEEEYG